MDQSEILDWQPSAFSAGDLEPGYVKWIDDNAVEEDPCSQKMTTAGAAHAEGSLPRQLSGEFEQVLAQLKSLEQSLLRQRHLTFTAHDQLAKAVALQVVEELQHRSAIASQPLPPATTSMGSTWCATPRAQPPRGDTGQGIGDPETNVMSEVSEDSGKASEKGSTKWVEQASGNLSNPFCDHNSLRPYDAAFTEDRDSFAQVRSVRKSLQSDQDTHTKNKLDKLRKSMAYVEHDFSEKASEPRKTVSDRLFEVSDHQKDTCLDLTVATIIVLNAIVIGISLDNKSTVWEVVDFCFTLCFLVELALKFKLHGVLGHFSRVSNVFDFILIVLDVTQLFLAKILKVSMLENAPSASIFRVVRLARLARLIRLARLHVFDELVAMITGLVGGMSTLMWSIVFFGLIVYITALLFREFYGNRTVICEGYDITEYFDSVPRAMYTTFRYFFGDFTTTTGISLFEAILNDYGAINGLFVSLLFFMITIGLFNVIAAIFVESTLAAAYALQNSRKSERMNDELLWGTRISFLVKKLFEYSGFEVKEPLSQSLAEYSASPIYEDTFARFIKDRTVIKALRELEIGDEDHKYLFDILDNDNTGDIIVAQLSDGIERLRGDPRRSDIICVDLMVRSVQTQANFLVKAASTSMELLASIDGSLKQMENVTPRTPSRDGAGVPRAPMNKD